MKFQFLHAADLHLDSPLEGLARYEGAPVARVRSATREAFEKLIDDAIRLEVKFIVLAGDISDGSWNDVSTGLYFSAQCARATKVGIGVYILWGNHDAESDFTKKLKFPQGVHTFGHRKPERFDLPELKVALTGQSYAKREVFDNLARDYPGPEAGRLNIGVLHTSLTGGHEHHQPYAPVDPSELIAKGYDYWALGHVHTHKVVHESPWIVFPGNLQGRSVRETGVRGAMLVSVEDGRISEVERLPYDVMRWRDEVVDLSGAGSIDDALDRIGRRCAAVSSEEGKLVAVRLRLNGRTEIHGRLFGSEKNFVSQVRGVAVSLGENRCWIEKVSIQTQPLRTADELAARGDAMSELQALLDRAAVDPEVHAELQAAFTDMRGKVLDEVLSGSELADCVRKGEWVEIVNSISPGLVSALGEI